MCASAGFPSVEAEEESMVRMTRTPFQANCSVWFLPRSLQCGDELESEETKSVAHGWEAQRYVEREVQRLNLKNDKRTCCWRIADVYPSRK
jgi:hypothetical protein